MSIWLGGLALLVGAVLVRGRERSEVTSPVLRFSSWASAAVTALIATGIYQTLREVRSWEVLLHTHYGHVLVLKLGVVALAFAAAAASRAWCGRRRTRSSPSTPPPPHRRSRSSTAHRAGADSGLGRDRDRGADGRPGSDRECW
jgi:copper transport protein